MSETCSSRYEGCQCAMPNGHEQQGNWRDAPHRCSHGLAWAVAPNGNKVVVEWIGTPPC